MRLPYAKTQSAPHCWPPSPSTVSSAVERAHEEEVAAAAVAAAAAAAAAALDLAAFILARAERRVDGWYSAVDAVNSAGFAGSPPLALGDTRDG
jgi:hypothetical protein